MTTQEGWPKSEWGKWSFGCLVFPPLLLGRWVSYRIARWRDPTLPETRAVLNRCADEIAADVQQKPYEYWYDHWTEHDEPITFERVFEGRELQVEIHDLELKPEYVHIDVSVDDGRWSAY